MIRSSQPSSLPFKAEESLRLALSLCMIVRDNAATIPRVLESIQPWVDEIVVVDTGSRDETPRICAEFGARVFSFNWCDDFSAARNESLAHARGEWVYYMDSDDLIDSDNGRRLREFAAVSHDQQVLGGIIDVAYPPLQATWDSADTISGLVRIFRNRKDIRFEGAIHESVIPSIERCGGTVTQTGVTVVHALVDRSADSTRAKLQRDLRILNARLGENPNDGTSQFYLGMTLISSGEFIPATAALKTSLDNLSQNSGLRRKAWSLYALSFKHSGDPASARRACQNGLVDFPGDSELSFVLATLDQRSGRLRDAESNYRTALLGECGGMTRALDRGITGFKSYFNLAVVYYWMGRLKATEVACRKALSDYSTFEPALRLLRKVTSERSRTSNQWHDLERLEEPKIGAAWTSCDDRP